MAKQIIPKASEEVHRLRRREMWYWRAVGVSMLVFGAVAYANW